MSPICPSSISTLIVVAKPTINAPGAALDTLSSRDALIVSPLIFEPTPQAKAIIKKIKLGRLETSSDFKEDEKETKAEPEISEIKSLKITTRSLTKKDIAERKLPNQTTGLVITNIDKSSPVNYLSVNDIIVEVQKKKIKSPKDLEKIVEAALRSNQKTILIVVYNNQNQRRYIGVKLD